MVAEVTIGYTVVLKIVSPCIMHNVDVGGVKINVKTKAELRRAYKELLESVKHNKPDANIWGVFVQQIA